MTDDAAARLGLAAEQLRASLAEIRRDMTPDFLASLTQPQLAIIREQLEGLRTASRKLAADIVSAFPDVLTLENDDDRR